MLAEANDVVDASPAQTSQLQNLQKSSLVEAQVHEGEGLVAVASSSGSLVHAALEQSDKAIAEDAQMKARLERLGQASQLPEVQASAAMMSHLQRLKQRAAENPSFLQESSIEAALSNKGGPPPTPDMRSLKQKLQDNMEGTGHRAGYELTNELIATLKKMQSDAATSASAQELEGNRNISREMNEQYPKLKGDGLNTMHKAQDIVHNYKKMWGVHKQGMHQYSDEFKKMYQQVDNIEEGDLNGLRDSRIAADAQLTEIVGEMNVTKKTLDRQTEPLVDHIYRGRDMGMEKLTVIDRRLENSKEQSEQTSKKMKLTHKNNMMTINDMKEEFDHQLSTIAKVTEKGPEVLDNGMRVLEGKLDEATMNRDEQVENWVDQQFNKDKKLHDDLVTLGDDSSDNLKLYAEGGEDMLLTYLDLLNRDRKQYAGEAGDSLESLSSEIGKNLRSVEREVAKTKSLLGQSAYKIEKQIA